MQKRLQKIKEKHKEYHYALPFTFNGFFEEAELYADLFNIISTFAKGKEFSSFKLAISWPKDLKDEAQRFHLKYALQNKLNKELAEKLGKTIDFKNPECTLLVDFVHATIHARFAPVFVQGRYCKFSRIIAQTEYFCNKCYGRGCWYCKGTGHFSAESVEELLGAIFVKHFIAKDIIMHGAGREDMDVRMLGTGRPFIMELISPEIRTFDLSVIEKEANAVLKEKVSVNSFKFVTRDAVAPLKDDPHDKIYHATVRTATPIDTHKLGQLVSATEIPVIQKTPTRVAKRRANLEREKKVTIIKAELIDATHFALTLRTSHGTYVKEFISGDGEKTKPSISSLLGVHCFCELLDVLEICD